MNANEFIELATANGWTRKQTRNELYRLNDPAIWSQRDDILTGLGFAPVQAQPETAAQATPVETPVAIPEEKRLAKGQMVLKFAAKDVLTGNELQAGTIALGVKLGGQWDFTAEPISFVDFKKLREAMLYSLDEQAESILDHEDYYMLAEFGNKYPAVARMIGCNVPGLDS